jgi:hypothetical protein
MLMTAPFSLQRIVVVPRNGYANRLQAWASAAIIAAQWDVPLMVFWDPEAIAPAAPTDLFAASLVSRSFIDDGAFHRLAGRHPADIPRYLTVDQDRSLVVLAGHDRGEQVFMPQVERLLTDSSRAWTLVIIAGGRFRLSNGEGFSHQRGIFYRRLQWSEKLEERVARGLATNREFVALHIRQTDRSRTAPTQQQVRDGLQRLRDRTATRSLFVSADTSTALHDWKERARRLGFVAWSMDGVDHDRRQVRSGIDALADWRILAASEALVHPANSTFSEEAAVASGHPERAIPLQASPARMRLRQWSESVHTAATYPARRLSRPS